MLSFLHLQPLATIRWARSRLVHAFVFALSRASVSSNFPEDEASFWQGSAGPITLAIEQLDNITFVLPTSDQVKSQKPKGKFWLITFFLISRCLLAQKWLWFSSKQGWLFFTLKINLTQNCAMNFQKFPYFLQKWANICQNLTISFKIMLNIGKILTFVSKKHQKWSKSHEFLMFFNKYVLNFSNK